MPQQAHPERLGASIFSPDDIYLKLKDFKSRLPLSSNGSLSEYLYLVERTTSDHSSRFRPHLYFVKVDVQACFDSIDQAKLLEILRQLILEVTCFYSVSLFLSNKPIPESRMAI